LYNLTDNIGGKIVYIFMYC